MKLEQIVRHSGICRRKEWGKYPESIAKIAIISTESESPTFITL